MNGFRLFHKTTAPAELAPCFDPIDVSSVRQGTSAAYRPNMTATSALVGAKRFSSLPVITPACCMVLTAALTQIAMEDSSAKGALALADIPGRCQHGGK